MQMKSIKIKILFHHFQIEEQAPSISGVPREAAKRRQLIRNRTTLTKYVT